MRLLTFTHDSFSLVWFPKHKTPPYAILSHTWGLGENDEVTFKDLVDGVGHNKSGFRKLQFCMGQAHADGLNYCWVDTCCIDKSNSTELQTSINSMFRWYKNAAKCYVYLSDVIYASDSNSSPSSELALGKSRWFTRGWTLQELLAPQTVEFYSQECVRFGDRQSLQRQIHDITGIPLRALQGHLREFGIQERLSWAEKRNTTEEEDSAYCLLGIFDVHMPLIYGEGRKNAMDRLLRKIRKSLSSESLLLGAELSRFMPHTGDNPSTSGKAQLARFEKGHFQSLQVVVPVPGVQLFSPSIRVKHSFRAQNRSGAIIFWSGPVAGQMASPNRRSSTVVSLQGSFGFELRILFGRWLGSGTLHISFITWRTISGASSIYWGWKLPHKIPYDSDILGFARNSDLTAIRLLFQAKKASPFVVTPDGQSLLHIASRTDCPNFVKFLLDEGADPNARDNYGRTPLHIALAVGKSYDICRMLLANHADLEIIDVEGKTPCHTFFNSTTGQLFLSMREEVRNIITLDNNGMSIAHYAAWSSHSQPSHLLSCIEADDINSFLIRDHLGRSILHFAAQRGNLALLQYVLSLPFRLDVNCKDVFGQTSLHYATESRRVQAIDLLLTSGAKIDAVDLRGRSPMHRAASKNNTSAIDCIIRYTGIEEVARLDFEGNSPAQVAHAFGSKEAAEHLNGLCNESLRSRQPESPHTLRNNVTGPQRWTLGIEEVLRNIRRVITWRSLWSGSFIVVVMWFVLASDRSH